jgi:hypothetical protein
MSSLRSNEQPNEKQKQTYRFPDQPPEASMHGWFNQPPDKDSATIQDYIAERVLSEPDAVSSL